MTTEEKTRVLEWPALEPVAEVRTDPGLPPFLEGETLPAQVADHPKFEPSLSKADYETKIRLLEEEVEVLRELLKKRGEEMVEANRRCLCGLR